MAKKILIIEDDITLLNLLRDKFLKKGYLVLAEKNGLSGFNAVKRENPDLILLDMVLPEMSGMAVLENLKNGDYASIPVIVISNSGQPVEIEKIKKLGIYNYLIKTEFDPEELSTMVDGFFNRDITREEKKSINEAVYEINADKTIKNNMFDDDNRPADKTKIMIVEDDKFLRELLAKKFEKEGAEVRAFPTAEEALAFLKNEQPHIILLDIVLPGMSGFEFLKKIKEEGTASDAPVIILSNLSEEKDEQKAAILGAKDFLVKALYSPNEIVKKTKEILVKDYI